MKRRVAGSRGASRCRGWRTGRDLRVGLRVGVLNVGPITCLLGLRLTRCCRHSVGDLRGIGGALELRLQRSGMKLRRSIDSLERGSRIVSYRIVWTELNKVDSSVVRPNVNTVLCLVLTPVPSFLPPRVTCMDTEGSDLGLTLHGSPPPSPYPTRTARSRAPTAETRSSLRRWIVCFATVNFNVDLGPVRPLSPVHWT
jgi:hypothetical protein